MTASRIRLTALLPALILVCGSLMIQAQSAAPKPIALEDYAAFKRITGAAISNDGKWMHYTVTPNDGDATLYVKSLDTETVHEIPRGANPAFSDDGRWIGYFIAPPASEARGRGRGGRGAQGQGAEPPAARPFEIIDLTTGTKSSFPSVGNFAFSPDGEWLLIRPHTATAAPAQGGGAGRGGRGGGNAASTGTSNTPAQDLLMRRLATGEQRYLAKVAAYAFDDAGKLMAYTVRGQGRLGNGVYLMTLATGEAQTLNAAAADYDGLAWSSEGTHLAVLRGDKPRGKAQRANVVLTWRNAGTPQIQSATFDPAKAASFPADMVVSEFTAPRWSSDGDRVLIGLKEQEDEKPESNDPQANVDVWHWQDDDPQSVQIVQLNNARRATKAAVLDVGSGALRQIADEKITSITPTDDLKWAIGRDETPYSGQIAWGGRTADVYRVDLTTGERTLIERGLARMMGLSPDGKWALYLKGGRVHSFEMATGKKTVIDAGRSFVDAEDDHDYEKPVYGMAGFTTDDRVLLYDRYDVWALPLAGGPIVNLTKGEGARASVRYRVTRLDRPGGGGRGGGRGGAASQEPIDLSKPVLLSAFGEWTKKSGYSELTPGGSPAPLIWTDKNIGSPIAAKEADRIVFTQQTFNEYPNYWTADKRFQAPRQVTDAYPDVFTQFAWGSKKLIDYKNSKGQRLQATLTLPAGYEPGKKYPMLVYFYELMSDTHHNFSFPVYDDRPHMSTYASNGYLVLQPDVRYEIGKPGTSALDCVTSAVKEVIKLGYADPARIGLQGHSWGGYQSSFIVTQTDLFAAVVTGAPPTNLVSFYNTLYRSSGNIQQGITEVGQVRMGRDVTPWSAHELYESQSPIHNAPKITTPFMILHGTADGSVDYGQGLEFYAAARRLGKPVILLSYPDEGHHLGRRENQKDFQIRMRQFFDHYLKGAPAPLWMTEGVPQLRKGLDPLIIAPPTTKKTIK
ncbi:MAG TPA: prolyl oligopeptidase family serine peptidase [Vicinamibacterales bacterium]